MNPKPVVLLLAILSGILVFAGCAQYKITHEMEQPIDYKGQCSIGNIGDELPSGFDEEDKPSLEQIEQFKTHLRNALEEKLIFSSVQWEDPETEYQVTGGIRDFRKGSGAVRFLIGFGAGNAKMMVALRLEDQRTGEVLFAGNFKQEVSSGLEKGDIMFERVANDFAKALEKQIKKLEKKK